jgi:hypothetical protein
MVQVLGPRAGVTGLIATLAKWGMQIVDVASAPSVGVDGTINVANGSGAWRAVNGAAPAGSWNVYEPYQVRRVTSWHIESNLAGNPRLFRVDTANTQPTMATGRLLQWNSGLNANVYVDPPAAVYGYLSAAVAEVLTAAQLKAKHLAVKCAVVGTQVILPDASTVPAGTPVTIKNQNFVGVGFAPLVIPSVGTIDGAANYQMAAAYESRTFQSDGANWMIVGGYL